MEILEKLYLVLLVLLMILVLSYVTSLIIDYVFLRKNYKKVLERGYTLKYEKFYFDYKIICEFLNVAIGSFEIVYVDEQESILKIKNNYFVFTGCDLTFLFNEVNIIEKKIEFYTNDMEEKNEQNDI